MSAIVLVTTGNFNPHLQDGGSIDMAELFRLHAKAGHRVTTYSFLAADSARFDTSFTEHSGDSTAFAWLDESRNRASVLGDSGVLIDCSTPEAWDRDTIARSYVAALTRIADDPVLFASLRHKALRRAEEYATHQIRQIPSIF